MWLIKLKSLASQGKNVPKRWIDERGIRDLGAGKTGETRGEAIEKIRKASGVYSSMCSTRGMTHFS